ncbi:hypothetical protein SmJEL517_g03020 [Synchytrium microbalum]|uniref:Uncharacterized protein n=1 Tax=Synchytrium microbalum TaxID=1806994 RepID=A0A507C8N2_9FUNG|nr:uncharacterized protein SmJEL517_g03020 [Synchytrium microbalum]TPX34356.1 hypothetical protein SmJEL517_g03020 [Synchytrium microbalum]
MKKTLTNTRNPITKPSKIAPEKAATKTTQIKKSSPSKPTNKTNDTVTTTPPDKQEIRVSAREQVATPPQPPAPKYVIKNRDIMTIPIADLPSALEAIYLHGEYTPLILDETGRVDTFFTYATGCITLDMKMYMLKVEVQKTLTLPEVKETLRSMLIPSLLKYGNTMCFTLSNSAPMFTKYYDPTCLPLCIFEKGGRTLMRNEVMYSPCVRPEDVDTYSLPPILIPNPEFKVLVTSRFSVEDYEEFLASSISLENFIPVCIEKEKQ